MAFNKAGTHEGEMIMKILLVDDEVAFIRALSTRLSIRGIDAHWAGSPEDAIAMVEKDAYDIAVLDMKMPKVDGIGLKRLIYEKCPDMKFIFLTGHGSEESFKAGVSEAGARNYLLKPVDIEDLMVKIKKIMTEKQKENPDG